MWKKVSALFLAAILINLSTGVSYSEENSPKVEAQITCTKWADEEKISPETMDLYMKDCLADLLSQSIGQETDEEEPLTDDGYSAQNPLDEELSTDDESPLLPLDSKEPGE